MENKKKILIGIGSLLIIILVIGISYALWTFNIAQTGVNTLTTDCFKIEFTDNNAISLSNAYPIEDKLGMELTPYTFTLKNVCNGSAKYQINLETMTPSGTKLPDKYLKVNLTDGTSNKITTKLDKSINSKLATDTTISGAVEAYKLVSGIMAPGETKEFNLRLWMHSEVTVQDEDSMNATYNGKISIISSYYEDNRGTLMATTYSSKEAFYNYRSNITKVVFEDKISPKETELKWDVSAESNKSVISYLVLNESDTDSYTLYIQSDGGIKANKDSSYLFYQFTKLESIEGLELLDASKVTNMGSMFSNCSSLTSLDLNSFDTSQVTRMYAMFEGCSSLISLDLSNFDTSKVTGMVGMFRYCSSLISLDLSNFDTNKVTDMGEMFRSCRNLTSLNLSNFDTSQVAGMLRMFYDCSSLTSLDLSNFNTSQVTTMNSMFSNCSSLTNLNLSNFDNSKVTDMVSMFKGCSSLTNLNLSNFNTSQVTNMSNMFSGCSSLTSLDLSNFDTSKVTSMGSMFSSCSSLTSLDVSNFDTSKVTDMSYMFYNCINLTNLDLSSFDTSQVTNMLNMFNSMPSDSLMYVKDESVQSWVLTSSNNHPSSWTTDNVIIKA